MTKESVTPTEMADRLASLLPPALTPSLLEDYGLEQMATKASEVVRELFSLSLFWMTAALEAHYPGIGDVLVLPGVHQRLQDLWGTVYGLPISQWEPFCADLPERFRAYERAKAEGGSALSVSMEAAERLEANWVVGASDRPNLLALLVDLVPVDAIGDLFEAAELVPPDSPE